MPKDPVDVMESGVMSLLVRSLHTIASAGTGDRFDAVHVRVFYPAQTPGGANNERPAELSSGMIAADATLAPFPVVVICNPVNIGPEYYRWLALALAPRGYVFATFSWLSAGPGAMIVQAGGPLGAMGGHGDQAPAIQAIVASLHSLNVGTGLLSGVIDTSRVAVIGHSAGGTMALGAADHRHHPSVRAVISISAHTAIAVSPADGSGTTMRPTPTDCPVLLIGGTNDGVIDRSRFRYDTPAGVEWDPVDRTFREAFTSDRGDCVLAIVDGANHFSFTDPDDDPSAGRPFLDYPAATSGAIIRAHTAAMIGAFLDQHVRAEHPQESAEVFDALIADPLISLSQRR